MRSRARGTAAPVGAAGREVAGMARRTARLGLSLALAASLAGSGALAGCADGASVAGAADASADAGAGSDDAATAPSADAARLVDGSTLFSARDLDPSYDEVTATVTLSDDGTVVDGSGVSVDGSEVTVTEAGTYVVAGSLSDGRLVVDAGDDDKVQLVLDGASVTASGPCALYVRNADKVFLTLADGSENELVATGADASEDDHTLDGTVFSADDLTVNGAGSLSVSSAQGHGVVGKDELTLVSGTLAVTAARHALAANDSVAVAGGTYELSAGTDGVHCESDDESLGLVYVGGGELRVTAGSDGLDASGVLQVDGGTVEVAAGDDGVHAERDVAVNGGELRVTQSYEALEGSTVTVTGGTLELTATDDGINAAGEPGATDGGSGAAAGGPGPADQEGADTGAHWQTGGGDAMAADDTAWVLVSGGTLVIDAGGDGIDSNGDLTVSGGETYVSGPTEGADGAIDYAGTGTITGGTLVAAGASGMAQNMGEDSTQVSLLVSASGSAGDAVTLADAAGTVLASFSPTKAYQCVLVSAPGMEVGETYTLTCGSTTTEVTADSVSVSQVGLGGVMGEAPGGTFGGGSGDPRAGDAGGSGGPRGPLPAG